MIGLWKEGQGPVPLDPKYGYIRVKQVAEHYDAEGFDEREEF